MRDLKIDIRECTNCRKTFRPDNASHLFCSSICQEARAVKQVASSIKRTNVVPRKHRGSWGEMIASAWLLEKGYEVFANVSHCGPIDLVAIRDQDVSLIDVKLLAPEMCVSVEKAGKARMNGGYLRPAQNEAGIKALFVSPDGFCSFNRREVEALYTTIYKTHLTN